MKRLIVIPALLLLAAVAYGQTLQKDGVLCVHHLKPALDPDVTMNQYVSFIRERLIPEYEKQFEGVKLFILKGLNREVENGYGICFYWNSVEDFNRYVNNDGSLTETGEAAMGKLEPVYVELLKLGTVDSRITDWVIQE